MRSLICLLVALSLAAPLCADQAVTLRQGQTATLTVTANGTPPIVYRWYRDSKQVATGGVFATNTAGVYSATAENAAGWVASEKVLITVTAPTPTPTPIPSATPTPRPTPTPTILPPRAAEVTVKIK